ncbi:unnamed protein product (mitochondrion) [Plasmodiophora brassicae]|uniref:DUF676 domain-containing protein n=1 Tax=Plasmodiophora brassicae TaxID=37360 RepID=A0A3P3YLP4_PLABS|nr:unnamed protein product [Plasmodiophora brassicae]
MEGCFELAVHLASFRNIDLYRQGLYRFRVSCYTIDAGGEPLLAQFADAKTRNTAVLTLALPVAARAIPFRILEPTPVKINDNLSLEQSRRAHGRIDSNGTSAYTRMFRVQYCDQRVELNDTLLFRIELDVVQKPNVYLDVEMMCFDLNGALYSEEMELPSLDHFEVVSRKMLRLPKIYDGLRDYYPLTTSDLHFACVEIILHSLLINFQFNPKSRIVPGATPAETRTVPVGPQTLSRALFPQLIRSTSSQSLSSTEGPSQSQVEHDLEDIIAHGSDVYRFYMHSLVSAHNDLCDWSAEYNVHLTNAGRTLLPSNPRMSLSRSAKNETSVVLEATPKSLTRKLSIPDLTAYEATFRADKPETISCDKAAWRIRRDLNEVAAQIYPVWNAFIEKLPFIADALIPHLKKAWHDAALDRWGACIFRETLSYDARFDVVTSDSFRTRARISDTIRASSSLPVMSQAPIEDLTLLRSASEHVVVFKQIFLPETPHNEPAKVSSIGPDLRPATVRDVIVFVHGYQGRSSDLRLFRNTLAVKAPCSLMLSSTVNEERTDGPIENMGKRLAAEIAAFLQVNIWSRPQRKLGRVSFMIELQAHFYTFFSLGCPHLGYIHGSSLVFDAGLWFIQKLYKSVSLSQMSMTDDPGDARQSMLYKLSKQPGLEFFNNVVLVSSPQDQYVPHNSARLELTSASDKWGTLCNEMARNILEPLQHVCLLRFDISFVNGKWKTLDQVIGRAAHILFLDQPLYIQMLTHVYGSYFVREDEPKTA